MFVNASGSNIVVVSEKKEGNSVSINCGITKETDEAIQKIPKELQMISKNVGKVSEAVTKGSKQIADSILSLSNVMSNTFTQIVSEMERANKLNEYYMLQDKIAEFEDELFRLGVLDKVYENMQIIEKPVISINEKEAMIIVNVFENQPEEYEKFKRVISQTSGHPINILETLIVTNGVKLDAAYHENGVRYAIMQITNTNIKLMELSINEISYDLHDQIIWGSVCLKVNEDTVKEILKAIGNIQPVDQMYKVCDFMNFINCTNADIVLNNLRNLYFILRNEVRRYRR